MVPGPVVYPRYLDLSKDECCRFLRQLELEAYAAIISALRSQGDLTKEKKELLVEICTTLGISQDRHRAEIRRAVNDEKLATIALHVSDSEPDFGWVKEGSRIAPVLPRPLPITAYMEKADRVAEIVARENALLPPPSMTADSSAFTLPATKLKSLKIPPEADTKGNAGLYSFLYCIKCQKKQEELVDESTSTDDLQLVTAQEKNCQDSNMAPSASDSYVFLPGGTTVRVELGSAQKEDPLDAYSLKATSSGGNIDFESAPDISLSGPRSAKRKRKKLTGISVPGKDVGLTIKQIIKPTKTEEIKLPQIGDEIEFEQSVAPEPIQATKERPVAFRGNKQSSGKQKSNPDSLVKHPAQSSTLVKSKRKSKSIPHVAIQHTPVPPEHLYAVGSSHRARQRQTLMSPTSEDSNTITASQKLGLSISKHQSPLKHIIGHHGTSIGPMSPPLHQHQTFSNWVAEGSLSSSISTNFTVSNAMPYSHSARFSSSKSSYLPPNIVQNSYARAQRFRANLPVIVRQAAEVDQRRTNKFGVKKEMKRPGQSSDFEDPSPPKKVFRSSTHPTGSQLKELRTQSMNDSPSPEEISIMRQRMFANTSGLDELASASLMDSAMISSTIVETGLAPVSAIVSRVTSPAPRPLSSIPSTTKNIQEGDREEGNSAKIIHSNESILSSAKQAHGAIDLDSSMLGSAGSHVSISNVNLPTLPSSSSISQPVVIVDSKQQSYQKDFSDSIIAISGSDSMKNQVRVALTESLTHVSSSAALSSIYPISLPQASRTISSVAGKPHTVLKSSTGNVITVTAKPLTGMKSVSSTIVSGGNIVKPPLGQKTSIIVVHKAAGAKTGKSIPTNFTAIGGDGQPKVITVSTKNLATPTINLPRATEETSENTHTSFSALGSIQGLVSGLTTSTTVMKPGKIPGSKPKFVAMPLHKKTMIYKPEEPQRAKVIQKVIGPPGKVLVKTSTPPQIRNLSTSRMVKPIQLQSSSSIATSSSNTQVIGGHDIVAAALSQSLGTVSQSREHASPSASITGKAKPLESPTSSGIIKLSTSTPAASTIKAFAANYQKKSSTSHQKQTLSLSTIHKPLPSTSVGQSSHIDKPKVFLTSSGHPKSQLFTPSQAQLHRPAKTGYLYDGRPPVLTGSAASYLASVGNLVKPLPKNTPQRMVYQQAPLHQSMQVKVLGQTSSMTRVPPRHSWQINSSSSSTLVQPQVVQKECDETTAQTKFLQDFLDSSTPVSQPRAPGNQTTGSDRATFIYQYLPTAASSATPAINRPNPLGTISMSNMDGGDIITLHSVTGDTIIKETGGDRDERILCLKNTVSNNSDEGTKHTNFVKVNLPSVRAPSPVVFSTGNLNIPSVPSSVVDTQGFSLDDSISSSPKFEKPVAAFQGTSECCEHEPTI